MYVLRERYQEKSVSSQVTYKKGCHTLIVVTADAKTPYIYDIHQYMMR